MIGAIAGQQGFSPDGKTAGVVTLNNSTTSYEDVVNITGSGYLQGISLAGLEYPAIKIVIDGVTKLDSVIAYSSYATIFSLPFVFRFESSLQIQVRNNTNAKGAQATVAYLLD